MTADQQQTKMVLVVAVALIDNQQRVLLAQRPEGKAMAGLWEFPGGKVMCLAMQQTPAVLHRCSLSQALFYPLPSSG
jgi:ADP-ribose pyrophosphatase YjhB (NUDIX family)